MKRTRVAERFGSVAMTPHGRNGVLAAAISGALYASAMLASAPAVAQQAPAAPAAQQKGPLEEIIVTARYREERLQEIPIAITAVSAEEIEMRAFTQASDIGYTVPNASFRAAPNAYGNTMTAFIRGIGQYDFDFAFEPGVGIYIDDVYHPFTLGSQIELLDLERVEVLRGPQGTLFGRGSIGGAIRYITKKPEGDDTGSISLTYGDFDRLDLRASYDFAITDNLFGRVTGVTTSRDGYQDVIDFTCAHPEQSGALPISPSNFETGCKTGTHGGQDVFGGRAMLRWVANDNFEVTLAADYQEDDSEPKADTLILTVPNIPSLYPNFPFEISPPYDDRFVPSSPYVNYATYDDPQSGLRFPDETELEKWTVSGRADWDITDQASVALILAYTELTSTLVSDTDLSPLNIQMTHGVQTVDFLQAELRFSGRVWDRMDYTVGGFYYDGNAVNNQIVSFPFLSLILDNVPPTDPSQPFVNTNNVHDTSNESVYAHVVFDVTDNLSINAGLRYSSDEKIVNFDNTRVQNPHVVVDGSNTDWRLGLDYKFTDDFLTYASVSTGYRPGSYNPRPFQASQVVAVDAEDSEAYELGFKSDLFEDRLRLNVALFYTDWKTRITPTGGTECPLVSLGPPLVYSTVPEGTIDPRTGLPVTEDDTDLGNFCFDNIAGPGVPPLPEGSPVKLSRTFYENTPGEVQGAEVELVFEPIDGLVFSGAYGMLEWDSPDINDDPNVVSDRPVLVPEDNWTVSASYAIGVGDGATLTPRVDVYGQSEICSQTVFVTSVAPDASCTDAYELVNVRLDWMSPDNKWNVAIGATNVTDEEYFLNVFDLTPFQQPYADGQPGRPREWYITFGRNF